MAWPHHPNNFRDAKPRILMPDKIRMPKTNGKGRQEAGKRNRAARVFLAAELSVYCGPEHFQHGLVRDGTLHFP